MAMPRTSQHASSSSISAGTPTRTATRTPLLHPRLPPELLPHITAHLPPTPASLLPLLLTNKPLHIHLLPHLYHHLTIPWTPPPLPLPYRLILLIRALLLRPQARGWVRSVNIGGWNRKFMNRFQGEYVCSTSTEPEPTIEAVFQPKEVMGLKRLLAEVGGEAAAQWIAGRMMAPEAVVGVIIFLLSRGVGSRGGGANTLREFKLVLPGQVDPRYVVDILWAILDKIIPGGGDPPENPFPCLSTISVKATRSYPYKRNAFSPSLGALIKPFLRLSGLTNLELSALTREPFTRLDSAGLPATNITILTLRTPPHLSMTLLQLLKHTPKLTELGLTFLSDLSMGECRVVSYADLGGALQLAKRTLTSLNIYFFEYGPVDPGMWDFGVDKGFVGDPRALQLGKLANLAKLTICLSVLLGPDGGGSAGEITLPSTLPPSLTELWVTEDCSCDWEWEDGGFVRVLCELIREQGSGVVGGGGCLRKIGVVRDLHMLNSLETMYPWPEKEERGVLERVGGECGVEMAWDIGRTFWREGQEEGMGFRPPAR